MNRATQEEMLDRRVDMLHYYRLGIEPKVWIPEIAKKFGISEEAIKKDWSKRKDWMTNLIKVENAEDLAKSIFIDYEISILDTYRLHRSTEDPKTRIQALWARLKAIQLKKEFLREIGALDHLRFDFRLEARKHSKKHQFELLL